MSISKMKSKVKLYTDNEIFLLNECLKAQTFQTEKIKVHKTKVFEL